jgi:Protein of unknown function DUF2834
MDRKKTYLFLCALGVLLPYSQIVPWIRENGWNTAFFLRLLFANGVSGACVLDVLVTSAIVVVFIVVEGRRLGMRLIWLPLVGLPALGVPFALPMFLYLRERALEGAATAGS